MKRRGKRERRGNRGWRGEIEGGGRNFPRDGKARQGVGDDVVGTFFVDELCAEFF